MTNQITEGALNLRQWAGSIEPYARWLDSRDFQAARAWAQRLKSQDPGQVEGAVAEAVAWDWLEHRVDDLQPVRTSNERTPDFSCSKEGQQFFVEITTITRSAMTQATGMPDADPFKGFYRSPATRLHRKILDKAGQGTGLEAPFLVLVATLHWNGSGLLMHRGHLEDVLHSRRFPSGEYDDTRGEVVGPIRETIDFKRAAFTRAGTIRDTRANVSGILFGPFGLIAEQIRVHGILNPAATRTFDHRLLPETSFCRFVRWPLHQGIQDEPVVEWTGGTG